MAVTKSLIFLGFILLLFLPYFSSADDIIPFLENQRQLKGKGGGGGGRGGGRGGRGGGGGKDGDGDPDKKCFNLTYSTTTDLSKLDDTNLTSYRWVKTCHSKQFRCKLKRKVREIYNITSNQTVWEEYPHSSCSTLSTGAIVGISIGGFCALVLACFGFILCMCKKPSKPGRIIVPGKPKIVECKETCNGSNNDYVFKNGKSMFEEGHKSYASTWICDNCDTSHKAEVYFLRCNKCDLDFCSTCIVTLELSTVHKSQEQTFSDMDVNPQASMELITTKDRSLYPEATAVPI